MASLQTGSRLRLRLRLRLVSRGSVWALREALEGRDCRISLEIQVWPQAKQLGGRTAFWELHLQCFLPVGGVEALP